MHTVHISHCPFPLRKPTATLTGSRATAKTYTLTDQVTDCWLDQTKVQPSLIHSSVSLTAVFKKSPLLHPKHLFFSRLRRELNGAPNLRRHYKLGPNVLRITKLWNSENLPIVVLVSPALDEVYLKRRCAQSTISLPRVKNKQMFRTLHLANQKHCRRSARSKSQLDEG